jgi:hypothetical protein
MKLDKICNNIMEEENNGRYISTCCKASIKSTNENGKLGMKCCKCEKECEFRHVRD